MITTIDTPIKKARKTAKAGIQMMQEAAATQDVAVIQPPEPADRMLAMIERAAFDPRANVEKMRALLDMKMELVRDDRRIAYNIAMWKAQGAMTPIVTKAWNESTKSYFAKLAHVDNIVRPIYRDHGFSLSFDSHKEIDCSLTMFVDVMHTGGHTERRQLNAGVDDKGPKGTPNKTQPQGVASTTSILQRKLTVMVFNLTFINEDDDGQGGVKAAPKPDRFKGEKADDQPLALPAAAHALQEKLKAAASKEKRGEILMKHIKILQALQDDGQHELVATIRTLAEQEVTNAA